MNGCIFCAIAARQQKASLIYEDDRAMVFMDLFPVVPGHVLVIPKTHAPLLSGLDRDIRSYLMELTVAVVEAQKRAGLGKAANVLVNDGVAANQHVPHVHFHAIPRQGKRAFGALLRWGTRMAVPFHEAKRRQELDDMAIRIASHFNAPVESG